MAICFPGMASRVNLAATSAIRPVPLVITTKLMITKIRKTMIPTIWFPPTTNSPNALMIDPAAPAPWWPSNKIKRVEAILIDNLNKVAIRSTLGKEENSSALPVKRDTNKIRTAMLMLKAIIRSRIISGRGTTMISNMPITPPANATSEFLITLFRGMLEPAATVDSLMKFLLLDSHPRKIFRDV